MKFTQFILLFLLSGLFLPGNVYSEEKDPSACDCNNLVITTDEEEAGCTDDVKREACAQYRQIEDFRESIKLQKRAERFNKDAAVIGGSRKAIK